jgi:hypothetical protein
VRALIVSEIKRIAAANDGRPPGSKLFETETGIGQSKWRGTFWARWGDALAEAGFSANTWQTKLESESLLDRLAQIVRGLGKLPTYSELMLMRRSDRTVPNPKTLRSHFSDQMGLIAALRGHCDGKEGFVDVASMLPEIAARAIVPEVNPQEGWVYLLKSGNHYKIGRSDQLEDRIKRISIALPETTTLVHSIRTDDPPGIEAYWHRRFAASRANGEWFKLTPADVAAFSKRKYQ